MFNIYYLNYNKAFEIAMLQNNEIPNSETQETSKEDKEKSSGEVSVKARVEAKVSVFAKLGLSGSAKYGEGSENNAVQKIVRNVEIIRSKSILLQELLKMGFEVEEDLDFSEGSLVKLDGVSLMLKNEEEVRSAKMMKPGTVSEMAGFKVEGMELNADILMNSMLSDYFYLLSGINNIDEKLLLKIPLSEQFESSYSIDDLLIGKVTLIGMYKGKINEKQLSNTVTYFNSKENSIEPQNQVVTSTYTSKELKANLNNSENDECHFIDVIAVLQNIIIPAKGEKSIG